MARRYYSSTAVATTLAAPASNSATSIEVTALSGYPVSTPWTAILDPDTASEEVVEVTGVSGTTLTVTRGVDGTTAVSHSAGAVFRHGVSGRDFDEANSHVNDNTNDVHSQYVTKSLVDAKADLITATGDNTPARLAVGSNGDHLVADSGTTTGLRWQPNYNAGRNRIINGGFDVWQRGTSFATNVFTADRWFTSASTALPTAHTVSRQSFTPGTAPVAGYEAQFFFRSDITTKGSMTALDIPSFIEDVRTFAGQTVTVSFWAKSDSTRNQAVFLRQQFGAGGSSNVLVLNAATATTTTEWQRFSFTVNVPSVSGKTIAASSSLGFFIRQATADGSVLDLWGVQVEAGSVATPFEFEPFEATLRKCQRYYWRQDATTITTPYGNATASATTNIVALVENPTTMRTSPTSVETKNLHVTDGASNIVPSGITIGDASPKTVSLNCGVTGATQYRPYWLRAEATTDAYLGFSAEL
jgi:hypothetical protein